MVGLIVMANHSGIGIQSRRLCYLLKPGRILAVDSTPFAKNKKQNWDWYSNFTGYKVEGFPNNREVRKFMSGLTHLFLIENPFNFYILEYAREIGCKVFIQSNPEFNDHWNHDHPLPHMFLAPSRWKMKDMERKFGKDRVRLLPPPIDPMEFDRARNKNMTRTGRRRFLHTVGTLAAHDRNGTLDLIQAVRETNVDFQLVIRSQEPLPPEYYLADDRVTYRVEDGPEVSDIYFDYDAMLLPRRYGGLCLPCNEALMAGLPVIMPAISPNEFLPLPWRVPARQKGTFQARIEVEIYETNIKKLAQKIEQFATMDQKKLDEHKIEAFNLAFKRFGVSSLAGQYQELLA